MTQLWGAYDRAADARVFFPALMILAVGALSCAAARSGVVPPSDPRVAIMGRTAASRPDTLRFGYPGVTLRLRFEGPSIRMRAGSTTPNSRIAVIVDGSKPHVIRLPQLETEIPLAEGLSDGLHTIDIVHRTETWQGIPTIRGFVLTGGRLLDPLPWPQRRLLFIGDSVTCGEAIDRQAPPRETIAGDPTAGHGARSAAPMECKSDAPASSNAYDSYGMLLGRALDAQVHLVCYGGRGLTRDWRGSERVANAPQFFDLAIVDAPARSPWNHAAYVPDVVVVSLGTNDFNLDLGPLPERERTVSAYVTFARAIRARYSAAHVFLTEGAIVSDETDPARPQKSVLRAYLAETARRLADPRVHVVEATHYPGDACNPHPTRDQHAAMAHDLEPVIRQALGW